jgi:hypothetical protein
VGTPQFSPVAGAVFAGTAVTFSSSTAGAIFCYTTDGTTPTSNGAGTGCNHGTQGSTFTVTVAVTLNVLGTVAGMLDSNVAPGAYTILVIPNFVASSSPYISCPGTANCNISYSCTVAGNLLLLVVKTNGGVTFSVTDTKGYTWGAATPLNYYSGQSINMQMFYASNCATGADTITIHASVSTSFAQVAVLEYTNVSIQDKVGITAQGTSNNPNCSICSGTGNCPVPTGELIVAYMVNGSGVAFPSPSGWNGTRVTGTNYASVFDRLTTGSDSISLTTGSEVWTCAMAVFK